MGYALTGLEGKTAVVTGAGRLRLIGRPIAVALARAGCDIVLTGTGRDPGDEKEASWRDIEVIGIVDTYLCSEEGSWITGQRRLQWQQTR